jgi:dihydrolipoamide dehydrogenase
MTVFDLAVVGGGPGGYATALRAANHGMRVAIVEQAAVGGTCLHRGCVPSKALLHVGRLADEVPQLIELGLAGPGPGIDAEAAKRFSDSVVDQLHTGLKGLLKARTIEVIHGRGSVAEPGRVVVSGDDGSQEIRAGQIVIATGSAVAELGNMPFDHDRVLSSDDALRLARVPRSAAIIGAGAVGIEFASLWCSLGAKVTVLEMADRVLPLEDPDSSAALARALERRGVTIRTGATVRSAVPRAEGVVVEVDDSVLEVDQVLVAVGRRPSTDGSGLEELGVLDARGYVEVDAFGRCRIDGIWAVGDVVPTLALAHVAFAEGFVVADAIAGRNPQPVDHRQAPRVTYCTPEVASVGLSEPEARELFDNVETTTVSLNGNARALIEGQGGRLKLVTDAAGTVLGVHIVGPGATELISEATLATSWGALAGEIGDVIHAHPTVAEGMREAALRAAGMPFHG